MLYTLAKRLGGMIHFNDAQPINDRKLGEPARPRLGSSLIEKRMMRNDDMIVSSGCNISGAEIEEVSLEHASVSDCAIVGVPNAARGQIG